MKTFFTVAVVVFLVLMLGCVYFCTVKAQAPVTEEIGKLMVTFNDSTKRNEFFTIYNQQGCPANIYVHDTMWQWGTGGYGIEINVYS